MKETNFTKLFCYNGHSRTIAGETTKKLTRFISQAAARRSAVPVDTSPANENKYTNAKARLKLFCGESSLGELFSVFWL